jgi:hypothetical protein
LPRCRRGRITSPRENRSMSFAMCSRSSSRTATWSARERRRTCAGETC